MDRPLTDRRPGVAAPRRRWPFVVAVCALAAALASHAGLAARQIAPTYDEPFHALASWLIVNEGDFRLTPDHPPYWRFIAGLPLVGFPMTVDLDSPAAAALLSDLRRQAGWAVDVVWRTPGNDGHALIARARLSMLAFPLALALVVARWAHALAGRAAALFGVALLSLDPTLLAHGGLATSDVAAACVFAAAGYLTWRMGTRCDARTAAALAAACAIGAGVKMNCLLLAPMVGLPLLWRAVDAAPWAVGGRAIASRAARLAVVFGFSVATAVAAWSLLWVGYGFRHAPTSGGRSFDDVRVREADTVGRIAADLEARGLVADEPSIVAGLATYRPDAFDRALYATVDRRLLPQAWGFGLSFARATTRRRAAFLDGDYSSIGFASYFPRAIAYKTPVTVLLLGTAAAAWGLWRSTRGAAGDAATRWTAICLVVPPALYLTVAMRSNVNIGLRHLLPVFPFAYVAIAVVAGGVARTFGRPRVAATTLTLAVVACGVETLGTFPNYLAFFNAPSGGPRGGLARLGDSNLDWGQGLAALADWHRDWRAANPGEPFHLSYFGSTPPAAYGIDAINAVPGYDFAAELPVAPADRGGVYAVSATHLQAIYAPGLRAAMAQLRATEPLAVVADTIYIYRIPRRGTPPATAAPGQ